MANLDPLIWQDDVRSPANTFTVTDNADNTKTIERAGTVIQQGTQQSAEHFNHMENVAYEALQIGGVLAQELRQHQRKLDEVQSDLEKLDDEIIGQVKTVNLVNTLAFPFNNSKQTVAITTRANTDYRVLFEIQGAPTNVGDIFITDKTINTFKIEYTGSAAAVTVKCYITGGKSIYG